MPVATIAATFDANSSRAPRAWPGSPDSSVRPTTASGGTSEIAMATPGSVSETSSRTRANAPTRPVASDGDQVDEVGADPRRRPRSWWRRPPVPARAARAGSRAPRPRRGPGEDVVTPRRIRARSARTTARAVPEDRGHQRRDDHRADHRRVGVGDDPGAGDDRRQRQQHPEGRLLAPSLEEEPVGHAIDVRTRHRHHAHRPSVGRAPPTASPAAEETRSPGARLIPMR